MMKPGTAESGRGGIVQVGDHGPMDERERQAAEERLDILEALLVAQERRHDVIEIVWAAHDQEEAGARLKELLLSLIHISEPTRRTPISYAVFCLKKKKKKN